MNETTKMLNKIDAWKRGKNPWITFETGQKNAPYKKQRANDVWGDPRISWIDNKNKKEKTEASLA